MCVQQTLSTELSPNLWVHFFFKDMHHVGGPVGQGGQRIRSLGIWVTDGCEPPCEYYKSNLHPMEDQRFQLVSHLCRPRTHGKHFCVWCFVCMSVHHFHAWCPPKPEESIRSPDTGLTDSYKLPCGVSKEIEDGRAESVEPTEPLFIINKIVTMNLTLWTVVKTN